MTTPTPPVIARPCRSNLDGGVAPPPLTRAEHDSSYVLRHSYFPRPVLLLLLLPAGLFATVRFSVDYSTFQSSHPDSMTVEVYHSLPFVQLQYEKVGDTLVGMYVVKVRLTDLATRVSTVESLPEWAVIPVAAKPAQKQMSVAHSFSLNLWPGRYLMEFEIRDSADRGSVVETLEVRDLRHAPSISDPIIGNTLLHPAGGPVSVLPLASRTFGGVTGREMYIYLDGYGFAVPNPARPETLFHELTASILDSSGAVVKKLPPEKGARLSDHLIEIFGLTTQGLVPGRYRLLLAVRDLKTDSVATARKEFFVVGVQPPEAVHHVEVEALSPEERKDYRDIRRIATDREWQEYQSLNEAGKDEYLRTRFWRKHDFEVYRARLQIADARYNWGARPGRGTDEGGIYIKYGEPDEVETHTMVEHTQPEEHWHYYNLGFHFVFIDTRGDGHMRLVFSNTNAERRDPNWENLVDPLELDDLQHEIQQ